MFWCSIILKILLRRSSNTLFYLYPGHEFPRTKKKNRTKKKAFLSLVYIFTAEYKNRIYENLFLICLFHHHKYDDITFNTTSRSAALYEWNKNRERARKKKRIFSIRDDDSKWTTERSSVVVYVIGAVCVCLNYPKGFSSRFNSKHITVINARLREVNF
jgi:hypothetical protein